MRDKRRGQAFVAGIGAAITLAPALAIPIVVPVLGLIAGPTMVVVSLTVLEDNVKSAQSGVSSAKDNVNDAENWLQAKKREKNNLCQQLKSKDKEKQITEQRLRDQERQLQDLQMAPSTKVHRTK